LPAVKLENEPVLYKTNPLAVSTPFNSFLTQPKNQKSDQLKTVDNILKVKKNSVNDHLKLTGAILTKLDGDTKGGVALSIANQVEVPLRFIGTGEKMPDLEVFIPDRIVSRLLGLGDIEGLAEKTSAIIDEKKAKEVSKKNQKR
jgi:flagellar biosynthesis GTPase FlhF